MTLHEQLISAETFFDLVQKPEYASKKLELVQGVIVELTKPGGEHGEITMEIGRLIANYVREHRLGRVTAAETGYILARSPKGRDTVRGPDVAFVSMARAPQGLPKGPVPFAPDFAVEVISPTNTAVEIHNKVRDLLRAGTQLIWLVYPDTRTVVVHTGASAQTLEQDDVLSGGEVIPGFVLPIRDIFALD